MQHFEISELLLWLGRWYYLSCNQRLRRKDNSKIFFFNLLFHISKFLVYVLTFYATLWNSETVSTNGIEFFKSIDIDITACIVKEVIDLL